MKDFLLNLFRLLPMFASDVLYRGFYRSRAIGRENIPKSGGVIIAPNHISGMETVLVPYMTIERFTSRKFWAPAKEELFKFAPLGWLMRACRGFPVRRRQHDFAAMNLASELAAKDVVMIFPEGTRSKTGKLLPGRPGVGKIIHDSRATVIPTVVFNTQYCLPRGSWFPNLFLPLWVVFGKPLDLERFYKMPSSKETSMAIVEELMKAIASLQKEYAHLDSPPKGLPKQRADDGAAPHSGS